MTYIGQARKLRRVASRALIVSAFALLSACSGDKESLLLVNAPIPSYAVGAAMLNVYVYVKGEQVAFYQIDATTNSEGKHGFYLPASASGDATVAIVVLNAAGCSLAEGSGGPVAISPSKTSRPMVVTFQPSTTPCGTDAGVDAAPGAEVGDGGVIDVLRADVSVSAEAGPAIDGPALDVAQIEAQLPDAAPDASLYPEVSADRPSDDAALVPEVGIDGSSIVVDTNPDVVVTPSSVLRNCTSYTHTVTFSSGTIGDWPIQKLVFSPAGNNLFSYGEDGRVKVWDVTSTGLQPNGLVFTGEGELTGAVSPDGKYLAVGQRYGEVTLYDLPGSIGGGSPMAHLVLPASAIPKRPDRAFPRHFTSDGKHLVVLYTGLNSPDPNTVAVWDLTTQTIVRSATFDYDDWPIVVMPGSSLDPSMWVVAAARTSTDGGMASLVTLLDIAQSSPTKTQAIVPGTVGSMAFSPDGKALAIGIDSNEVGLWDISDKTKLLPPTTPLISRSGGSSTGVYALSFSSDGSYLAVATEGGSVPAVKVASTKQKELFQKDVTSTPMAVAFAPGDLALAIGQYRFGGILYCTP
jgi:WD40 repeat protein